MNESHPGNDTYALFSKFDDSLARLTDKIDNYIERDTSRHEELLRDRIEDRETISRIVSTLDTMTTWARSTQTICPNQGMVRVSEENKTTLKSHTWLIRAIGVVLIAAALGGGITSVVSCPASRGEVEASVTSMEKAE